MLFHWGYQNFFPVGKRGDQNFFPRCKGGPEFFYACKGGGPGKIDDRPSQIDAHLSVKNDSSLISIIYHDVAKVQKKMSLKI